MRGRLWALAAGVSALVVVFAAQPAGAERIRLKNGRTIEGWIVDENEVEVVVAIIRDATVGKLTIRATDVESIDRRRVESLEEALRRAREERARRFGRMGEGVSRTAQPAEAAETGASGSAEGQPRGEQETDKGSEGEEQPLFEPLTEKEKAEVERWIRLLGDTRRAGGAGTRRQNARRALVAMGPKVIPALTKALDDEGNWYRRVNAASAIAEIARKDNRLALYAEVIPVLLRRLEDEQPWVRIAANQALEAISGRRVGFPEEPTGERLSRTERRAIAKWKAWWQEASRKLEASKSS